MADQTPTIDGKTSKGEADDILAEAKEAFELAAEAEKDNRAAAEDDLRFARLSKQWPDEIAKERERDGRPMLTINRLPAFIRQVVNDARQNKPSIKVHPADDHADIETADIFNGLIRNIETTSDADVAYDTATECAVSNGFGYIKVDLDYAHDDSFNLDLKIKRVADPFSIYADPWSTAADSSDWNTAFETEHLPLKAFKAQFPGEESPADWDGITNAERWYNGDEVMVARWWKRDEVDRRILLLSDGTTMAAEEAEKVIEADGISGTMLEILASEGIKVLRERVAKTFRVKRHVLTGAKVLRSETWKGRYIPIIPVYGDEVWDDEGTRHLRSLIRDAKDSQRNFNYWRSAATELVALAPKVPWIGPKGAFKSDARRWRTANVENHAYLEYDGTQAPQRIPLDTGAAAGALQEALNASDDMKAIVGLQEASLGEQGNERSGKAILARQREGDVSTFHFQDNMSRAIRHTGRILIDLIPAVYSKERIVRVMGEDGTPKNVPIGQPVPVTGKDGKPEMVPVIGPDGQPVIEGMVPGPNGQPMPVPKMKPKTRVFDLTMGKYDLTVTTGPSFTTRREEMRSMLVELAQAYPALMPVAGDILMGSMDFPRADELADRLKKMLPPQITGGPPPEIAAQMQQMQGMLGQAKEQIDTLMAYVRQMEADKSADMAKVEVSRFDAETKRLAALGKIQSDGAANVPDLPGPNGDWDGIAALAEADLTQAKAERERSGAALNRAKAFKEMVPDPAPAPADRLPALPQRVRR